MEDDCSRQPSRYLEDATNAGLVEGEGEGDTDEAGGDYVEQTCSDEAQVTGDEALSEVVVEEWSEDEERILECYEAKGRSDHIDERVEWLVVLN